MPYRDPIVFFGSGPVAKRSLELLLTDFRLEAIITKPTTANDMAGIAKDTPVYCVASKLELDQLISTKKFKSRLAVLVDFGIIVSRHVIDSFTYGIVNSHFSLLPQWRGADPIVFSILSGQQETGVSLMLLTARMDEGPLLAQEHVPISPTAQTPDLTNKLIETSDKLLKKTLLSYVQGTIQPFEQPHTIAPSYSRKLTKEDGIIDWNKSAVDLEREVRAFITWPKSRTTLAGREVIIMACAVANEQGQPGQVLIRDSTMYICCGKQALEILEIKPAGKSAMNTAAFLAGYRQFLDT